MSLIRKHTTEAMVAANRANSLKATGPVTDPGKMKVRLNALKHGMRSGRLVDGILIVNGDDERKLGYLRTKLADSFRPGTSYEELLLDEMAQNRWRKGRATRAETAVLNAQRLAFELEYGRKLAGEGRSTAGTGQASVAAALGLAALPDSSAKFNLILQCLRAARGAVEREGFGEEGRKRLEAVYGPDPGLAGAVLLTKYHERENEGAAGQAEPAAEDAGARQAFLEMLEAEIACFERLLELEQETGDAWAQARWESQDLPSDSDTRRITRYEAFLDHQFDRLVKQFRDARNDRGSIEDVRGSRG